MAICLLFGMFRVLSSGLVFNNVVYYVCLPYLVLLWLLQFEFEGLLWSTDGC